MKKRIIFSLCALGIFLMLAMSGKNPNCQENLGGDHVPIKIQHSIEHFRITHDELFFTQTYLNIIATDVDGYINDPTISYTFSAIYSDTIHGSHRQRPRLRSSQIAICNIDSGFLLNSMDISVLSANSAIITNINYDNNKIFLLEGVLNSNKMEGKSIHSGDFYVLESGNIGTLTYDLVHKKIIIPPGKLFRGKDSVVFNESVNYESKLLVMNEAWIVKVKCDLDFNVKGQRAKNAKIGGGMCVILETLDPQCMMKFRPSLDSVVIISSKRDTVAAISKERFGVSNQAKCIEFPPYYSSPSPSPSTSTTQEKFIFIEKMKKDKI